jgi:hypothetical protein
VGGGGFVLQIPKGSNVEKNKRFERKNLSLTNIKLLSKIQRDAIIHCNFETIITRIRGRPLCLPALKAKKKKVTPLLPTLDAEPFWLCKEKRTGTQADGM